jgi:hypothetical protein
VPLRPGQTRQQRWPAPGPGWRAGRSEPLPAHANGGAWQCATAHRTSPGSDCRRSAPC